MQCSNIPGHNSPDRVSVLCWCSTYSTDRSGETEGYLHFEWHTSESITYDWMYVRTWTDMDSWGGMLLTHTHTSASISVLHWCSTTGQPWTTADMSSSCFKLRMLSFIATSWPPRITHNYVIDDSNKWVTYVHYIHVCIQYVLCVRTCKHVCIFPCRMDKHHFLL